MRVPKGWISVLAKEIIKGLCEKKLVDLNKPEEEVVRSTDKLILDELMAEDIINKEVREMLSEYDTQIERGNLDYRRLFELTKRKLVRERDIIL
ncbi:MAG TPA: DUF507 family protein [Nitrospirae bacterium]|nr:hypothetical protein BMS3Abin10_02398 [bacterium BMS3Abin10]GBE38967.1 hypothetical protein BMS3Bbin08_01584 [bacterium BMS3Bbin08]HDH50531.1 DUF507 family protein [Nitrospirota bacterium]HDK16690.1 DUF507 family protein [Nitrospirota bacterium]HDK82561.1 DUF507 family protein [Nitrospirota bacterium]